LNYKDVIQVKILIRKSKKNPETLAELGFVKAIEEYFLKKLNEVQEEKKNSWR